MKNLKAAAAAGALMVLGLTGCEQASGDQEADTPAQRADLPNLIATLSDAGDLSTASSLIDSAGLTQTLSGPAPYTLFLPTNEALQAIDGAELARLKSDEGRPELIALLRYHIVPGVVAKDDLIAAIGSDDGEASIANVASSTLTLSMQGNRIGIGSGDQAALVVGEPVAAGNGVIYTTDRLVAPEDGSTQ